MQEIIVALQYIGDQLARLADAQEESNKVGREMMSGAEATSASLRERLDRASELAQESVKNGRDLVEIQSDLVTKVRQ